MTDFLWRLVNAVQFTFLFFWCAFWITLAVVLSTVTRRPSLALWLARHVWAPGVNRSIGLRIESTGTENLDPEAAYYFASNHQSFLDIPVLFQTLPNDLRFVAKAELRSFPFIGWFIRAMGMVFVDRHHRGRGLRAVDEVIDRLRSGHSILSFSEGSRGDGIEVAPFKSGGFRAPIAAGAAVVPVAIVGTSSSMPAGRLRLRPGSISVRVAPPIPTGDYEVADRHELARQTHRAVVDLLPPVPSTGTPGQRRQT